jgi:hypothetical protein
MLLLKKPKKPKKTQEKKPMVFLVFFSRGHFKSCYLDVLRQNKKTKKTKKTVGLNQWFFHANPAFKWCRNSF